MSVLLLVAAAIGFLPGEIERGEVAFRPGPEEASVPERFRLEPAVFTYELEPALDGPNYTVSRLRFPSPINDARTREQRRPRRVFSRPNGPGPKRPAVIVLHILGADFPLSRYMAARLADRGVAALFVKLPVLRRAPAGRRRPGREEVPLGGHRADGDRHAAGHLRRPPRRRLAGAAPEVDARRLGVAGISLGGIVSSIVVGRGSRDPRGGLPARRGRPFDDPLGDARGEGVPRTLDRVRADTGRPEGARRTRSIRWPMPRGSGGSGCS